MIRVFDIETILDVILIRSVLGHEVDNYTVSSLAIDKQENLELN